MSWQQPQDAVPYGQQPPVRQRSDMPAYGAAQPYGVAQPQPVIVNVIQQNNGGYLVHRRRVNHWFHFWMTMFTGGLWIPVWVHATRRR